MMTAHVTDGTTSKQVATPDKRVRFINKTRGTVVAEFVEVAGTSAQRTRGLLGRNSLEQDEGLWIVPCESVHTFGMRFSIDLVYLDKKQRIRKIRNGVPPWRISICFLAHSVIELPQGAAIQSHSRVGDQMELVDRLSSKDPAVNLG